MALSDPQSVTIGANTHSLPRVSQVGRASEYQKDDGTVVEKITHSVGKTRTRHQVRIDFSKLTSDPFIPTQNRRVGQSVILQIDVPNEGFTVTEQKDLVKGLFDNLSASTFAVLLKILGGES